MSNHIRELCAALGIPTVSSGKPPRVEPIGEVAWNGYQMILSCPEWHIYHDIAHWMLAPPERRGSYDFALYVYDNEEQCAAYLGVALHAHADRARAQRHASKVGVRSPEVAKFFVRRRNTPAMAEARRMLDAAGYRSVYS